MAYEKTVWQKGMVLTAENLNKIENALEGITSVVSVETDSSGVNTTGTTTGSLSVSGTSTLGVTNISGATTIGTQGTAANLTVNGNITSTDEISGKTLVVTDKIDVDGDSPLITTTGRVVAGGGLFGSRLGIGSDGSGQPICNIDSLGQIEASTITSSGDITVENGNITVEGTALNGKITGNQLTINSDASFGGTVELKNGNNTWMRLDPENSGIIYAPNITFGMSGQVTHITNSDFYHPHIEGDSFTGTYGTITLGYNSSTITLNGNTNANTISAEGNYILSNRTDTSGNTSIKSNYTIGAGQGGFWIKENITSPTTFNTTPTSNYTLLSLSHEVDANQLVYPSIYIGSPNNTTASAVHNIFLEAAGQVVLQGEASNGVVIGSNLYLSSDKKIKIGVSGSTPVELSAEDITHLHTLWTNYENQNGGE